MGWAVLYIAFGVVALWLLGEVLLQYKARLRWRLLAFVGFLGVVVGVLIPSVVVIGLGAAAFAVGQTYVTLSFRSGFAAGWAVSAPVLGGSRRRRGERGRQEPTLEVSDLEAEGGYGDEGTGHSRDTDGYGQDDDHDDVFTPVRHGRATDDGNTAVYEPQPMPDDTGNYGVYGDTGYPGRSHDQYAAQGSDQSYSYDYSGYGQQQGYDGTGQQQYAAYSDPYIGSSNYGGTAYDTGYGDQQYHGQQGYAQDAYPGTYGGETPPGGAWVPQQRNTDEYGQELPPEQHYPYQGGGQQPQGNGFDEQYRF
ncbi:SCO2102 family sporulation regulator [Streptomyces sp. AHA2]|uniref:SCO2102 family sporulation regulator n=1 Tax=Streptomyces sp. AHA2 TaxID=3064526 RepID=UPI002FE1E7EC